MVTGSLRRDQGDFGCLLRSLGDCTAAGLGWTGAGFSGRGSRGGLIFRRMRSSVSGSGCKTAGRVRIWPRRGWRLPVIRCWGLLSRVADSGGLVLTGRLSLADDPWLAGHTVFGRVIVPGSVFVEFALAAADRAGLGRVEELALEAVLALPAEGGVAVQVAAGPAVVGRRPVGVHARGETRARGVGG